MARRRTRPTLLRPEEIEALRTVLRFARSKIKRATMAAEAEVDPIDIDNFTSERFVAEGSTFKTKTPSEAFQTRMLRYLRTNSTLGRDLVGSFVAGQYHSLSKKIEIAAYEGQDDLLFKHLEQIGITDMPKCREISEKLQGSYYMYRLSSDGKRVVKSYIKVHKYDVYKRVPYFEHFKKEDTATIRKARGTILEIKGKLIFHGLIVNSGNSMNSEYVGVKLIILDQGLYERQNEFSGLYLSCNDSGDYEFGPANVVRTLEDYDERNIGNSVITTDEITSELLLLRGHRGAINSSVKVSFKSHLSKTLKT